MQRFAWVALVAVLTGSVAQAQTVRLAEAPAPRPDMTARALEFSEFEAWRDAFRTRALGAGIAEPVFDTSFRGITPSRRILDRDDSQPEIVRAVEDYIAGAVSTRRVADGQRYAQRYAGTLAAIEARYGVDSAGVLAIWGMETAYGAIRGDDSVIRSLATLAFEGRRRDWAERELIAVMTILQSGKVLPQDLRGSWAGAMGHTQFMPTSYLNFAQDFDGDGVANIWSENPTDALASAAHYLKEHGWVQGAPWGVEVTVPAGFNYLLMDRHVSRPVSFWNRLGVRTVSGGPIPDHGNSAMLAPAGAGGPVFLTFANFDAIRSYNRSTSYAIAVGHLAERISGAAPIATPWPRGVLPLPRKDRVTLQESLTALGYDTQGTDGLIGPNTERAIRAFQVDRGLVPDGMATNLLFDVVVGEAGSRG
ncbi:MAG: lytic murein transglycosylase [Pseudomonadota bacterium]